MNLIILSGNLGADPELRKAKSGTPVCNLSLATNERVKENGEWVDHTEWHNIVVFGNQATTCEKFLSKGSRVLVEGKVRKRTYTDKTGVERRSLEVIADRVEFGSRSSSNSTSPPAQNNKSWNTANDDGIPF